MSLEIERKWLIAVDTLPFSLTDFPRHHIVQSYVSFDPQIRLRDYDGAHYVLTIKGSPADDPTGLVRIEHEFEISRASYDNLSKKTEGKTLVKTRYLVPESAVDSASAAAGKTGAGASRAALANAGGTDGGPAPDARGTASEFGPGAGGAGGGLESDAGERLFEIDVYEGEYAGLAVAEMEFPDLVEAEAFPSPSWALLDVSTDRRFRNVAMARPDEE